MKLLKNQPVERSPAWSSVFCLGLQEGVCLLPQAVSKRSRRRAGRANHGAVLIKITTVAKGSKRHAAGDRLPKVGRDLDAKPTGEPYGLLEEGDILLPQSEEGKLHPRICESLRLSVEGGLIGMGQAALRVLKNFYGLLSALGRQGRASSRGSKLIALHIVVITKIGRQSQLQRHGRTTLLHKLLKNGNVGASNHKINLLKIYLLCAGRYKNKNRHTYPLRRFVYLFYFKKERREAVLLL